MDEREGQQGGCGQAAVIGALVLWVGVAPILVAGGVGLIPEDLLGPTALSALQVAGTALLLLLPPLVVALIARRRATWQPTSAAAAAVLTVAGYVVLDAAVRSVSPTGSPPTPYRQHLAAAGLRLAVLLPYALLMAWFAPRLAGVPRRPLSAWLGLHRARLSTLLLGGALAALVTLPWPVTGALGDRFVSLGLAARALARVVPETVVFWGVGFLLLTASFPRPWLAGMTTILLYGLAATGGVLPDGDWLALQQVLSWLPLGFLLTELRARRSGIYPLLDVAFAYRVAPLLFVDPRDAMANGIPEPQHILSRTIVLGGTLLIALLLWGGRRLTLALREGEPLPRWAGLTAAALALVVLWGLWGGLYLLVGEPGFADDGFLIILSEQADLGEAYGMADREERLQWVYDTLVETAEETQAPLRAELDELGLPYRPYYLINMIRVDGHANRMRRFEDYEGVDQVLLNPNVREYPYRIPLPGYTEAPEPPAGVQSNLTAINADDVWALGVTGEGVVVAGQDTGYAWTHPALRDHYRGWDGEEADHDYHWYDPWDHARVPFDDDGHGTHTMGTVLGDAPEGRIGVAPGAQWIGCRNMRRGFGNPGAYAACSEFFLAPYPLGGDPFTEGDVTRAPHLVNNSWGCPSFEGCRSDTLRPAVEALRAAGIMMVVSAGNDGPACGTAATPPANYDAVFAVGATGEGMTVTGFSSRGPVGRLVKPDVSAPGAWVRSSIPGGGYGYAGGTSMAGPHVAGLVALLWSADPALMGDIDATEALICGTAVDRPVEDLCTAADEPLEGPLAGLENVICACGDVTGVPNNVYGCGFIDAEAAVEAALGE
jgi:hypothetical protein